MLITILAILKQENAFQSVMCKVSATLGLNVLNHCGLVTSQWLNRNWVLTVNGRLNSCSISRPILSVLVRPTSLSTSRNIRLTLIKGKKNDHQFFADCYNTYWLNSKQVIDLVDNGRKRSNSIACTMEFYTWWPWVKVHYGLKNACIFCLLFHQSRIQCYSPPHV